MKGSSPAFRVRTGRARGRSRAAGEASPLSPAEFQIRSLGPHSPSVCATADTREEPAALGGRGAEIWEEGWERRCGGRRWRKEEAGGERRKGGEEARKLEKGRSGLGGGGGGRKWGKEGVRGRGAGVGGGDGAGPAGACRGSGGGEREGVGEGRGGGRRKWGSEEEEEGVDPSPAKPEDRWMRTANTALGQRPHFGKVG